MKRITLILISVITIGLLAVSCKTKEKAATVSQATGDVEIALPFTGKEYQSDDKCFRANNSGKSMDMSTAKKMAMLNAQRDIAQAVQVLLKSVSDQYTNQKQIADVQEFEQKFNDYTRTVAQQTMNDVRLLNEKVFKGSDGKFTYYVAIEMPKDAVQKAMAEKLSKDAKTQLDFDEYQIKKIFDEEMKKFEEGK